MRAEAHNDRTLIIWTLGCGVGGMLYGWVIASSMLWKILLGLGYGSLGVLIGVPAAFIVNLTRGFGR